MRCDKTVKILSQANLNVKAPRALLTGIHVNKNLTTLTHPANPNSFRAFRLSLHNFPSPTARSILSTAGSLASAMERVDSVRRRTQQEDRNRPDSDPHKHCPLARPVASI